MFFLVKDLHYKQLVAPQFLLGAFPGPSFTFYLYLEESTIFAAMELPFYDFDF